MIITFTANPSLDRSSCMDDDLRVGRINRLGEVMTLASGKGVNVSAAVGYARHPTLAILPGDASEPLAEALRKRRIPHTLVKANGRRARTNLTITHSDGSATRFNEPGEPLRPEDQTALTSAVLASLPGASWLALCGSLPPGSPVDWYVTLTERARSVGVRVAVDAYGPALGAVLNAGVGRAPDLVSPNLAELEQATGRSIRDAVEQGDLTPAVAAALELRGLGVRTVLATLGAHGALLANEDGVWHAVGHNIDPASVTGAGDAALAGYLLGDVAGDTPPECLQRAVAYGSACVLMAGAEVPHPCDAEDVEVTLRQIA